MEVQKTEKMDLDDEKMPSVSGDDMNGCDVEMGMIMTVMGVSIVLTRNVPKLQYVLMDLLMPCVEMEKSISPHSLVMIFLKNVMMEMQ
jgi:hypothetical protein